MNTDNSRGTVPFFPPRPESKIYFQSYRKERPDKAPHFLWNAKMRFGKTFAAYQLAKTMGWRKVLVLTFKPAVQSAWEEDLKCHIDFKGWQFISPDGLSYEDTDKPRLRIRKKWSELGYNL